MQTESTEANKPESAYDMQKLAIWLKSVYPSVTREINDANSNFYLFKSYRSTSSIVDPFCKLLQTVNWNAGTGDCVCVPMLLYENLLCTIITIVDTKNKCIIMEL